MISKNEFVSLVEKDIFPKLKKKVSSKAKTKRSTFLWVYSFFIFLICFLDILFLFLANKNNLSSDVFRDAMSAFFLYFLAWFVPVVVSFLNRIFEQEEAAMKMSTEKAFDFLGVSGVNFYGFDYNEQSTEKENDELFEKLAIEKYSQLEKSALFQKKFKRYPTHVTFFPPSHIEIFPETSFSFGNAISCFELSMADSPGSRGHYKTFFQGLFIEIKQKQFYENPIVFVKKGFFNSRKTLKKVPLRMQDSYFDIYSNDVMQAQNLFNARVATKLLKIKAAFNVKKVEASFYQNKLYIALYTQKDFFELENNLLDIKQYEDFYDDVAEIEKYCQQFVDL